MAQMDLSTLYNRALEAQGRRQQIQQRGQAFQQDMQAAQLQQREAEMGQAAREAQFFVSAMGEVGEDPEALQQGWSMARQALARAGGDVNGLSDVFNPQQFRQIQGLAQYAQRSQGGAGIQFGAQETFKDQEGNFFFATQRRNPRTGAVETAFSPIGGGAAEPVGQLSMVSSLGQTGAERIQQVASEAGAKRRAEADVDLMTRPQIEGEIARARSQAQLDESRSAAARNLEDLQGSLDRMRDLLEEGIYTGAWGDRLAEGFATGGIVFDQDKLNRTTRVRQIATNLKFMAKPAGMGAMSDSEWAIIRDAIPDPESATTAQIIAGLEEFEANLRDRAGVSRQGQQSGSGGLSPEDQAELEALRRGQR